MSQGQFYVTSVNPNDTTGGGGCLCTPSKVIDCKPPYILVPTNDMESPASPHVVVCQSCAHRMVELLDGEVLAAGERCEDPAAVDVLPAPVAPEPDDDEDIGPEV